MESVSYIDQGKRGRIIFLALTITVAIFLSKVLQPNAVGNLYLFLISIVFGLATYAGLLWALNFQITLNSSLFVLPQASLFAFSEVLFIETFFFRRFLRVYEALFLLVILAIAFLGLYATFLMANVFNVSTFKIIPLYQVGKTTSYILSLLMTYFLAYSILSAEINIFLSALILLVLFFAVTYFHIRHLKLPQSQINIYSIISSFSMVIMYFSMAFLGGNAELIALVPVAVLFVSIGILMHKIQNIFKWYQAIEYLLVIIGVMLVNLLIGK